MNYYTPLAAICSRSKERDGISADRFNAVENETQTFNHSWVRHGKRTSQEGDFSRSVLLLRGERNLGLWVLILNIS
jgi:hypothetical protein